MLVAPMRWVRPARSAPVRSQAARRASHLNHALALLRSVWPPGNRPALLRRLPRTRSILLGAFLLAAVWRPQPSGRAQPLEPQAPPPAPPIQTADLRGPLLGPPEPPPGLTQWPSGDPTDEEQLHLEYINRARANPLAEAVRLATTTDPDVLNAYNFFRVDLNKLQTDLGSLPPAPPLAMNAQLLTAARVHAWDMATNGFQGHIGTDGSDPGVRISRTGYPWLTYGENVFAYAKSVFHGYAGFEVDWGEGPGGMQDPPGHRLNIHHAAFREVGIGVVGITNTGVGPQVVAQAFATRQAASPLVTGVVYYDLNGNGFYDLGEGIGGVLVTVEGSSWYARTPVSGGFAVPVTTNGVYRVRFAAPGLSYETTATVVTQANVKVDFVPAYVPPVPMGPEQAAVTNDNLYLCAAVGAATNYQWETSRLLPGPFQEGAEGDLGQVSLSLSPGYNPRVTGRVASGTYAFHLAHPTPPTAQILQLNPVFWARSNAQLRFASRLGWATTNQIARAQISADGGRSWSNLWSQAGTGTSGDPAFRTITLALSNFAGQAVQLRFVYDYLGGTYYYQTSADVGWLLDDITVSGAEWIQPADLQNTGDSNAFVFRPAQVGGYLLRVRAQLPGRWLPWGPVREVQAQVLPPLVLRFEGPAVRRADRFEATFRVTHARAGTIYRLWRAAQLPGPWTEATDAVFTPLAAPELWRVSVPATGGQEFYRVSAN